MKIPKRAYTAESGEPAVKRTKDGRSAGIVCKEPVPGGQSLRNRLKGAEGELGGAGGRVVTPEEMELSGLRAENLRLKRENGILKKAAARFARDVLRSTPGLPGKANRVNGAE